MRTKVFRLFGGLVGLLFVLGGLAELLGWYGGGSPDVFLILLAFAIGGVLLKYSLTGTSRLARRNIRRELDD